MGVREGAGSGGLASTAGGNTDPCGRIPELLPRAASQRRPQTRTLVPKEAGTRISTLVVCVITFLPYCVVFLGVLFCF